MQTRFTQRFKQIIRLLLRAIFKLVYRVKIRGLAHYQQSGACTLIITHHISALDIWLFGACLPDELLFITDPISAQRLWCKALRVIMPVFVLDPENPLSLKTLITHLKSGQRCVMFPEGRQTMTGSLMKIYETPGLLAAKAQASILPIRIDGAQYTLFSRLKTKLPTRLFPQIKLTIQAAQTYTRHSELSQRQRRAQISERIYTLLANMVFATSDHQQTLYERFLQACRQHNRAWRVLEDIRRKPLTLKQLRIASLALGKFIKKQTSARGHVGLLLPNSNATIATFLSLHLHGRIPAMLNYTAGVPNILAACRAANIAVIYSLRQFIEAAQLDNVITALAQQNIQVIYLEDVQVDIDWRSKLKWAVFAPLTRFYYSYLNSHRDPNDPAVILFTSGSEGQPKGAVLSHKNILANCAQLAAKIDFTPQDTIFNALPLFHAFGLTAGTLLPLFSGVRVFLYPSPLHYRKIPEYIYATNASIVFGTDTFLANYAQHAHPYDFYSVRYIFAGAERLKPETAQQYAEKFGLRIFEGYGATETSPILSVNTPMHYKPNTVGRLLPGIDYQLRPVTGISEGGRLLVAGPNVMLGYLQLDKPGQLQPLSDPYYDTGDIVHIDEEGYLRLQGRAKRFAKIAGEMISLHAVEMHLAQLWPQHQHAVIRVPDAKKGEQLILVTDHPQAQRQAIVHYMREKNLTELFIPRHVLYVETMPLLGSGKIDYGTVMALWQSGKISSTEEKTVCA